jgi:hypothetical protein
VNEDSWGLESSLIASLFRQAYATITLLSGIFTMRSKLISLLMGLTFVAVIVGSQNLRADIVWNEAIDGDLSDDPSRPTALSFSIGANTVIGSLGIPDDDIRDFMTFTIGPNQLLTSLTLDTFSPAGLSFQAINAGSTGFIPGSDPAGNFLGLEFVRDSMVGTDMLPLLAAGNFGSTGFSTPLGPGTYTYLIQEVSPEQFRDYTLTFNVVPEPSSIALVSLVGVLFFVRRARRGQIICR